MKKHLREAIVDTFLGAAINFPLNIAALYVCSLLELSVIYTSIVVTIFFTFIAIIRKTLIRRHFYIREQKRDI